MIGKTIGLLLIMTASIVLVPVQVMLLFSKGRRFRGSGKSSNPTVEALCCNCTAEYEAGQHSH